MTYETIGPEQFLTEDMFRQDDFLRKTAEFDWEQYRDKKVLVRGCGDIITPPWAYMVIAARLAGVARSIRYGNEHDNVVVHRAGN